MPVDIILYHVVHKASGDSDGFAKGVSHELAIFIYKAVQIDGTKITAPAVRERLFSAGIR